jgi:steroid 5-alpha reductase family enzyme
MVLEIILGLSISYSLLFLVSIALRDNSIADVFWGLGFLQVAIHALVLSTTREPSQLLFTSLIAAWSLRLSSYIISKKWIKKGEDPRYAGWREQWKHFYLRSFFQVYLLQAALVIIIAIPILLIHAAPPPAGVITVAGLCIALLGLIYETIGDLQLRAFIKTKQKGQIMTQGLWKYSRHPNYFGESVFWLGASCVAAQVSPLAFISWIVITVLLRYVSGVPPAEERYADNPAFQAYKQQTPAMLPNFFK